MLKLLKRKLYDENRQPLPMGTRVLVVKQLKNAPARIYATDSQENLLSDSGLTTLDAEGYCTCFAEVGIAYRMTAYSANNAVLADTYDIQPGDWYDNQNVEDTGGGPGSTVVVDTVTSSSSTAALSANQGRLLNEAMVKTTGAQTISGLKTFADSPVLPALADNTTATKALVRNPSSGIVEERTWPAATAPTVINNTLSSTSTTEALSAAQGKALNDAAVKVTGNYTVAGVITFGQAPILGSLTAALTATKVLVKNQTTGVVEEFTLPAAPAATVVTNNLTSTSSTEALSANQGRILDTSTVKLTGNQTIGGVKTFALSPVLATQPADNTIATKALVRNGTTGEIEERTFPASGASAVINDTLSSTSTTEALSANQGRVLNTTTVKLTGDQSISGVKSFTSAPVLPALTTNNAATTFLTRNTATGSVEERALPASVTVTDNLSSVSTGEALSANQGRILDAAMVKLTGNQTIGGTKTFAVAPVLPALSDNAVAVKALVRNTTTGAVEERSWPVASATVITDNLASTSTVEALSANQGRVLDAAMVKLTGAQTINGTKTFSSAPIISAALSTNTTATEFLVLSATGVLEKKAPPSATTVNNTLTSVSTTEALSAAQGKALNDTTVKLTGDQTVNGVKTFGTAPVFSTLNTSTTATHMLVVNEVNNTLEKRLIPSTTINNTLNSTSTTEALSAAQGKVLNDTAVKLTGDQTIGGRKSFSATVTLVATPADNTTATKALVRNSTTGEVEERTWPVSGSGVTVTDALTSTSATEALSANQGRLLNTTTVKLTGDQTVGGVKSFSAAPILVNPLTDNTGATKALVRDGTTGEIQERTWPAAAVVDSLTSTSTTTALSANQGKLLNDSTVKTTGAQTISGVKTFASAPILPALTDNTTSVKALVRNGTSGAIEERTWPSVTINNTLTSTSSGEALSAAQGKVLKDSTVDLTTAQSIGGVKSFTSAPVLPALTNNTTATKALVRNGTTGSVEERTFSTVLVNDSLTSTSTSEALSAAQGKVLKDSMVDLTSAQSIGGVKTFSSAPVLPALTDNTTTAKALVRNSTTGVVEERTFPTATVTDSLTSTSTTEALSAAQGKILNDSTVKLTGAQTIGGVKTFSAIPVLPALPSGSGTVAITRNPSTGSLEESDLVPAYVPVAASRSLAATDDGRVLTPASGVTLTIPSGLVFRQGVVCIPPATGSFTLAAASGVSLNSVTAGTASYALADAPSGLALVYRSANDFATSSGIADATSSAKGALQLSGDLAGSGGTAAAPKVSGLQGVQVATTPPTAGQVLTATSPTAAAWATPAGGGASDATSSLNGVVRLAGDFAGTGGTAASPKVSGIQGIQIADTPPTVGQVLQALSGSAAAWSTPSIAATGQYGVLRLQGDLAGTGTTGGTPRVSGIQGVQVVATAPTAGQVLQASSGTAAAWSTLPSAAVAVIGLVDLTDAQVLGAGRKIIDANVRIGNGPAGITNRANLLGVGGNTLSAATNTANRDVAVGFGALNALTNSTDVTAMGFGTASALTTGSRVSVFGSLAATALLTGDDVTAFGYGALGGTASTSASKVTVFGSTVAANATGSEFVAVGHQTAAGYTGQFGVIIGNNAGASATGNYATLYGHAAGKSAGNFVVALGGVAMETTPTTTVSATAVGHTAAQHLRGSLTSFFGRSAGQYVGAAQNSGFGAYSLQNTDTANSTAGGYQAGRYGLGAGCTYFGHNSGPGKGTSVGTGVSVSITGAGAVTFGTALSVSTGKAIITVVTAGTFAGASAGEEFAVALTSSTTGTVNSGFIQASNAGQTITSVNVNQPNAFDNVACFGKDADASAANQVVLGSTTVTSLKMGNNLFLDIAAIKAAADGAPLVKRISGGVHTITV